jgi:hypothetical protein
MPTETEERPDAIELLLEQHNEARLLASETETARGDARGKAFERLVRLLAVHETAEEEVIYPVLEIAGADAAQPRSPPTTSAVSATRSGQLSVSPRPTLIRTARRVPWGTSWSGRSSPSSTGSATPSVADDSVHGTAPSAEIQHGSSFGRGASSGVDHQPAATPANTAAPRATDS